MPVKIKLAQDKAIRHSAVTHFSEVDWTEISEEWSVLQCVRYVKEKCATVILWWFVVHEFYVEHTCASGKYEAGPRHGQHKSSWRMQFMSLASGSLASERACLGKARFSAGSGV